MVFSGVLLIDADWLGELCLLVYRDALNQETVFWHYAPGELKDLIIADLEFLVTNNYPLKGVVSDGKAGIVYAVEQIMINHYLPQNQVLPHQRCLVHMQLFCQGLLTQKPKTEAGQSLLSLVHLLNQITNDYEKQILETWLKRWEKRYSGFINQKTIDHDSQQEWFTHKYLRRTFRTLKLNWSKLFLYFNYPFLPKDTNGIEGMFSQLDSVLSRHRGLKKENREAFISWFFFLKKFARKINKLQDIETPLHNSEKTTRKTN